MPSIPEQLIQAIEARVVAVGGLLPWGAGGVQRLDDFAVEREMRPAARIVETGIRFSPSANNRTEWGMASSFAVNIVTDSPADRDARWLAVCKAMAAPFAVDGVNRVRLVEVLNTNHEKDVTAFAAMMRFEVDYFAVEAWAPDVKR